MRLLHCHLENIRRHRLLDIDFSPGLTLISGANESGKSSLVEAMHRGLFLKATASGSLVEALRSNLFPGHPLIELSFEAKGAIWSLSKRFSGQSGSVRLDGTGQEVPLSGSAAEELLAKLLGVDEIVGSRQAARVLPSRWAHLWVLQGLAGQNLLDQGPQHYDLNGLMQQLEQRAEVSLQSPLDQKVSTELEALVEATFTSRGVRRNSLLWQCQQQRERAEDALKTAELQRDSFESTSAELDQLEHELDLLTSDRKPALKKRRFELQTQQEQTRQDEAALLLYRQQLEPLQLRKKQLQSVLHANHQIHNEFLLCQKNLEDGSEQQTLLKHSLSETKKQIETTQQKLDDLDQQRSDWELRGLHMRRLEELTQLRFQRESLQRQHNEQQRLRKQSQTLQIQLDALPDLSVANLQRLRDCYDQVKGCAIRIETMASEFNLERADQPVLVDGFPLKEGETKRLISSFTVNVGDGVRFHINPGQGTGIEELKRDHERHLLKYTDTLKAWQVKSLEEAEQKINHRNQLSQQLNLINEQLNGCQDGHDGNISLSLQKKQLENRQHELEQEMTSEPELSRLDDSLLSNDGSLNQPLDLETIRVELKRCRQNYRTISESIKVIKLQLQQLHREEYEQDKNLQKLTLSLEVLSAKQIERKEHRKSLLTEHGPEPDIEEKLLKLNQSLTHLGQKVSDLEQQLGNQTLQAIKSALAELDAQEKRLQEHLQVLSGQRGALRERCEGLGSLEPYAALEEARVNFNQAKLEEREQLMLAHAQQRLLKSFQQAQAELSNRYTTPLSQAICSYLQPLLGNENDGCHLNFDPHDGFRELGLRRDGQNVQFRDLSGGMKEQLNGALRLSIADALKGGHGDCLPILFDDAFTNTDPDRIESVLRMMTQAVKRGLQVIVLSCDPTPYETIADKTIYLPSP